ncbi:hypothetical protein AK88_00301 [Plasmodium fragile]|uniref:Pv-fam-d protein n=1 Tax=Plasmodium fragile TaxID=5857 RepID=A0A0D9QTG9_PLAFR|nr:uncharacterized protein AK88_00301 [Plasmodium fragile]KJP90132.1 hypothetical protein AK88_00301 [Plasmodium fragile]
MYRILFVNIFLFTLSAWILQASGNGKGLSHNVNNGGKNGQNGLQLRVPRLLSVNDLYSEVDGGSVETLPDLGENEENEEKEVKEERNERTQRTHELNLNSFDSNESLELDPDLETFKAYMRYVAKSDKSYKEKFDDTKEYMNNMDPVTRKKIKKEIKDKAKESKRTKHRKKCMKMHGTCQNMYNDLQNNEYRMLSLIRKMEKKMSNRSFLAGALSAMLAIFLIPLEICFFSALIFVMVISVILLLLGKI